MATGVQVWSKVPASNANSDSNVNYAEGQAPSSLNDSARAAMASVASWRDDNNGTLVTGGTTTAVTLVTNQVEGALTAGYTVAALLTNTVDVNATLSVDGLAAAPIQIIAGQNISYNILQAGSVQKFTYSTTGTGQWIVQGGVAPQVSSTSTSPLLTVLSNSLAANVTFATTVTDGPQTTQGLFWNLVGDRLRFHHRPHGVSPRYERVMGWDHQDRQRILEYGGRRSERDFA